MMPSDPPFERPAVPEAMTRGGVVAVARRLEPADVPAIAEALVAGGVGAFELTLNEPEDRAVAAIAAAADHVARGGLSLAVGAGTVMSVASARRAMAAGASFLVAPHLDPEVVAWAVGRGGPMLPGAAPPTEVLAAWRAGAAAVKVFPASSLGASFLRELRGPFPDIPLQPTGGISVDNAGEFIRAGAIAVGIGSWLFAGDGPASVTERARQAVDAVRAAREA